MDVWKESLIKEEERKGGRKVKEINKWNKEGRKGVRKANSST